MKACRRCGEAWEERRSPGFREECPKCREPLHACVNCRFYEADRSEWCREPAARQEKPRDREASNMCSYFLMGEAGESDQEKRNKARENIESLFRNDL